MEIGILDQMSKIRIFFLIFIILIISACTRNEGKNIPVEDDSAINDLEFDSSQTDLRAEIIARAKLWVDAKVPYSAAKNPDWENYRTDCSGYVSYAWQLDPQLVTMQFHQVADEINVDDLLPGDILNLPLVGDFGHAMFFVRWIEKDNYHFEAYEENGGENFGYALSREYYLEERTDGLYIYSNDGYSGGPYLSMRLKDLISPEGRVLGSTDVKDGETTTNGNEIVDLSNEMGEGDYLECGGEKIQKLKDLNTALERDCIQLSALSVGPTGKHIYLGLYGNMNGNAIVDLSKDLIIPIKESFSDYSGAIWTPDEGKIAFYHQTYDNNLEVWVWEIDGKELIFSQVFPLSAPSFSVSDILCPYESSLLTWKNNLDLMVGLGLEKYEIWDVSTGMLKHEVITGYDAGSIYPFYAKSQFCHYAYKWQNGGKYFATYNSSKSEELQPADLTIWNSETAEIISHYTDSINTWSKLKWSPDGKWVVVESLDGKLLFINVENGEYFFGVFTKTMEGLEDYIWSPDQSTLAFRTNLRGIGTLVIYEISSARILQEVDFDNHIEDFEWLPNGKQIALISENDLFFWDIEKQEIVDVALLLLDDNANTQPTDHSYDDSEPYSYGITEMSFIDNGFAPRSLEMLEGQILRIINTSNNSIEIIQLIERFKEFHIVIEPQSYYDIHLVPDYDLGDFWTFKEVNSQAIGRILIYELPDPQ